MALLLVVAGCATARTNQFKQFALAGSAYVKAVDGFLAEAGHAAVDTDSMLLADRHGLLNEEQRQQAILDHNEAIKARFAILADLRRHAGLLQSYFDALGALAGSDAPSGIGDAAKGVVDALGRMSGRIKDAKVGEQPVSDFVGAVVNIAVAHFRAAALQRELEARAESIERALDLQKAALSAVAATMRADLQVQLNRRELNEVIDPYLSNTIPKKWIQTRREVLSATVTLESAEAAADAADKLRIAFVALAEGRFGVEDLPALLDDINRIVTLIEAVRGKEE